MNDVILQGIMLILTGFAGFIVKTVKDYLFKEGGEKALRIVEIVAKNAVKKLNAAKTKVKKALEQYNIYLSDSQLEMFIEAAVKEMNDSWKGENK
ncbi:MAG: phage holin family protein [Streptococcus lutetiensis]|nr:phage holin family protein [Streptococcus lutetiensis]MDU7910024.1 phage holin family protein [Streptococcus lutetiensis]